MVCEILVLFAYTIIHTVLADPSLCEINRRLRLFLNLGKQVLCLVVIDEALLGVRAREQGGKAFFYWGTGNIREQVFDFGGTSQFLSEEQWSRCPPCKIL